MPSHANLICCADPYLYQYTAFMVDQRAMSLCKKYPKYTHRIVYQYAVGNLG
eukprot:SAG11_NODE_78_length_17939_cov_10.236883_17_plen_52_part_00